MVLLLTLTLVAVTLPALRGGQLPFLVEVLAFAASGVRVAWRRPDQPAGWLLLAVALSWAAVGALDPYARSTGAPLAAWLLNWVWAPSFTALGLFLLLFPDGRLPGPRWRVAAWAGTVGCGCLIVARAVAPGPLAELPAVLNPLGVPAAGAVVRAVEMAGDLLVAGAGTASVASLVVRYRHADGVQRRQLLWMALAGEVFLVLMLAGNALTLAGPHGVDVGDVYLASFAGVPVAAALAILRYRLFDIELVVGRALVLGGLVGGIGVVYVAVLVGIGTVVGHGARSNVFLAALATALAAAGAQPLYLRLRRLARRVAYPASAAEQAAEVAIRTLGAFGVLRGGEPVPATTWQSKKARTLVKVLVARRGRTISREGLAEILWPGADPVAVARRMSVALATARAVLDPGHVRPSGYFIVAKRAHLGLVAALDRDGRRGEARGLVGRARPGDARRGRQRRVAGQPPHRPGQPAVVGGRPAVIGQMFTGRPRGWIRAGQPVLALIGALGGGAVLVAAALGPLADDWLAADQGVRIAYRAAYTATSETATALFFGAFLVIGLYLAILAAAILGGSAFPRWTGRLGLAAAALLVVGDPLMIADERAFLLVLVGFGLFNVLLFALGMLIWRTRSPAPLTPAGRASAGVP